MNSTDFRTKFVVGRMVDLADPLPGNPFASELLPEDRAPTNAALEATGREYYEYRAALMARNNEGLTKACNCFHDPEERSPDIHKLRDLHAAMDRAVLAAYGWPDIPTACEFLLDYEEEDENEEAADPSTISNPRSTIRRRRKKPWRYRWPDDVRDEVLAKLLARNAERAEQERLAGTGKATAKKTAKNAVKKAVDDAQSELFPTSPSPDTMPP
ncbi:MAG: hypothetical protein NTW21_14580 [Verrucomicrobia bacterium]|nr:hypothetical protein [Verrucomicrobiota bacterium]